MPTPTTPARLTPVEIAARFDADEAARKARIARSDERHAARTQTNARAVHVDREILDVWTARFTELAADLDLSDAEDRVTFRVRMINATGPTVCVLIAALARAVGHTGPLARGRGPAARALADAWIERTNEAARVKRDAAIRAANRGSNACIG